MLNDSLAVEEAGVASGEADRVDEVSVLSLAELREVGDVLTEGIHVIYTRSRHRAGISRSTLKFDR